MKTFDLNGTKVIAREFDFNLICDLEDFGITLGDIAKKNLSLIRAYVAICLGSDLADAGSVLEEMVKNGKNFDGITKVMAEMIDESDFFRNLAKTEEQKATKNTSKKA